MMTSSQGVVSVQAGTSGPDDGGDELPQGIEAIGGPLRAVMGDSSEKRLCGAEKIMPDDI
jgi:hypothetical protein